MMSNRNVCQTSTLNVHIYIMSIPLILVFYNKRYNPEAESVGLRSMTTYPPCFTMDSAYESEEFQPGCGWGTQVMPIRIICCLSDLP